ncbi:MAG: hypothetical protein ABI867_04220 [Kofleriaceae bacterium]
MTKSCALWVCALLTGCHDGATEPITGEPDPLPIDATPVDSPPPPPGVLGTVGDDHAVVCPNGAPRGSTCRQIRVTGCPGIETEAIDATLAILEPAVASRGTITHLKGGGGEGFQLGGADEYQRAGFRQVFVSWSADWEQTAASGIKTAACRPATAIAWIFAEPTLHDSSREAAFCGEGFSGGSGQLAYALAHYGLGEYFDYVNALSGPPFTRIDLGCDGDAPATATVCGATVTMRLPDKVGPWENIQPPLVCGSTNVPAAELARWKADSIGIGGVYDYPRTRVEFFDCTNNATTVTGMAQILYDQIASATTGPGAAFHCFSEADHCQGEALGDGAVVATRAMIDGCTPRHR